MNIADNARTLLFALILATLSVGNAAAGNPVVVIPLAGDTETGISGYEIVTKSVSISPTPLGEEGVIVSCPLGKKVLGGGGSEGNDLVMVDSYPSTSSWTVNWVRDTGGALVLLMSQLMPSALKSINFGIQQVTASFLGKRLISHSKSPSGAVFLLPTFLSG